MGGFDEAKEQIKRMDLELWLDENCQDRGAFHSRLWCLQLYRRKIDLAILGDLQKTWKELLDDFPKVPYPLPKDFDFVDHAQKCDVWKEKAEKLLEATNDLRFNFCKLERFSPSSSR